jgi:hypothetical protein
MTEIILAVYGQGVSEERPEAFLTPTHDGQSKTRHNFPNRPWRRTLITRELQLGRISGSNC